MSDLALHILGLLQVCLFVISFLCDRVVVSMLDVWGSFLFTLLRPIKSLLTFNSSSSCELLQLQFSSQYCGNHLVVYCPLKFIMPCIIMINILLSKTLGHDCRCTLHACNMMYAYNLPECRAHGKFICPQ